MYFVYLCRFDVNERLEEAMMMMVIGLVAYYASA